MSNFNDQYWASSSGLNEATLKNALQKLSAEYQVKTSYTTNNIPNPSQPLQNINTLSFTILDCPLILTDGSYMRIDVDYYLGTVKNALIRGDGQDAKNIAVADANNTYTILPNQGILHPMNYPRSSSNLIQRSSMQINNYTYSNENYTGVHSDLSYLYQSMDYYKSTFGQHWNIYNENETGYGSVLTNSDAIPAPFIHLEEKDFIWINKTGQNITIDKDTWVPTQLSDVQSPGASAVKFTKTFIIPYKYINDVFTTPMLNVYSTNNPILTLTVSFVDKLKEMLTIPIKYEITQDNITTELVYYAEPYITNVSCYTKTIINYVDNKSAAKALSRFRIDNNYILPYYSWRTMTTAFDTITLKPQSSQTYSPTDTAMIYNIISLGMVIKQSMNNKVGSTNYRSDVVAKQVFGGTVGQADGTVGNTNETNYLATQFDNGYYPLDTSVIEISDFNVKITANNIQLILKPNIDKIDMIQQNTYATGYLMDEDNGLNYGKISLYQFENGNAFILFNFADIFNTFYKSGIMISPSSTLKVQCTFKNKSPIPAVPNNDFITLNINTFTFYKQYYTCDDSGITGLEQLNVAVEAARLEDNEQ